MSKLTEHKIIRLLPFIFLSITLVIVIVYFITLDKPIGERNRTIDDLGGSFTLRNQQGEFSLSDIKGKVGVLYFGFLNCTEACPDSILVVLNAYAKMSEDERQNVQFVFISVDPERDSLSDLIEFGEYYDGNVVAVTGTDEEIDQVTQQYGVYFDLVDLEGSASGYTVDHSSRFYMIDKSGQLLTTMSHSTTPSELAAKLKQMLQETNG